MHASSIAGSGKVRRRTTYGQIREIWSPTGRTPLMTHITVTVAIPAEVNPGPELYEAVSAALDPFDENLEVETYVDLTAQQIANDTEFQKFWLKLTEEKPAAVSFAHAVEGWWGGQLGEDGNLWSTCNPEGRWDWWVIGGRWAGQWVLKPGATRALAPQRSAFGFTEESKDPRRPQSRDRADQHRPELRLHRPGWAVASAGPHGMVRHRRRPVERPGLGADLHRVDAVAARRYLAGEGGRPPVGLPVARG